MAPLLQQSGRSSRNHTAAFAPALAVATAGLTLAVAEAHESDDAGEQLSHPTEEPVLLAAPSDRPHPLSILICHPLKSETDKNAMSARYCSRCSLPHSHADAFGAVNCSDCDR